MFYQHHFNLNKTLHGSSKIMDFMFSILCSHIANFLIYFDREFMKYNTDSHKEEALQMYLISSLGREISFFRNIQLIINAL